ncbi:MAG: hypothetical protein CSA70_00285 [Rhodobacterales bacterium]|nr:MAG: hypothetical protein CSA70_00285 [Rhodobacterales bacterium]
MTDTPKDPQCGLSEAAQNDRSWRPKLQELANALSDGEKSALIAALKNPGDDVALLTARGAPNDWFWAHLSQVGLMVVDEDIPAEPLRELSVVYRLTAEGRKHLPLLLRSLF